MGAPRKPPNGVVTLLGKVASKLTGFQATTVLIALSVLTALTVWAYRMLPSKETDSSSMETPSAVARPPDLTGGVSGDVVGSVVFGKISHVGGDVTINNGSRPAQIEELTKKLDDAIRELADVKKLTANYAVLVQNLASNMNALRAASDRLPTHASDVLRRAERTLAEKISFISIEYNYQFGRPAGAKAFGNGKDKVLLAEARFEAHDAKANAVVEEVHYRGDGSKDVIYRGKLFFDSALGDLVGEEGIEGRKLHAIFSSWPRL